MQIVVLASASQKAELLSKQKNEKVLINFVDNIAGLHHFTNADAFFILNDDEDFSFITRNDQHLFVNAVASTLKNLKLSNASRINAWPSFLQRDIWEIATNNEVAVKKIFDAIGWKYIAVADEPGLIAARTIAMIINEAYFAWEENVSSKEQIDIAMKLGTNYPYGPFEWAEKIGLKKIDELLMALSLQRPGYEVCPLLKKELLQHKA